MWLIVVSTLNLAEDSTVTSIKFIIIHHWPVHPWNLEFLVAPTFTISVWCGKKVLIYFLFPLVWAHAVHKAYQVIFFKFEILMEVVRFLTLW